MILTRGSLLGSYEVLARLGAGGMGEVYRARDLRLGREVALKVLPARVAKDSDRIARFEREARAIAALNHPNIVVLHSIEQAADTRFLTMELVEGQRLDELMKPSGMPLRQVLDLALSLADALAAAHAKGVVHRDLKPANVIVTGDGRVKVLDFGIAKLVGEDTEQDESQITTAVTPRTGAGQVLGTIPYLAPEQLRGQPVSAQTDLFALGVVLYELVTGQRPFVGASNTDITSAILRDAPVSVRSVRADVTRELARIIEGCLEKDPRDRFHTARDVHDELRLALRQMSGIDPISGSVREAELFAHNTPSIAVLPFVNMSGDEENEHFAEGLSEELRNVLAKIRGLRVSARTSSSSFKTREATIAEIGRQLDVATILEGSVRKAGERIRVTVQLVKVWDGYHLWSRTYDRDFKDIFAIQDEIAERVVNEIRQTVVPAVRTAAAETGAELRSATLGRGLNAEAYRLYMHALILAAGDVRSGVEMRIQYFQEAIALEPDMALAWAGLSSAYASAAGLGWMPLREGIDRAREAAQKALRIEPNLVEGHLALAWVQSGFDWDARGADESIQRALELAPGDARVVLSAGRLARASGRYDEALGLLRRSIALDPLNVAAHRSFGWVCFLSGRHPEADASLRKAIELNPLGGWAHYNLSQLHFASGRMGDAFAELEMETIELYRLLGRVQLLHATGDRSRANEALSELIGKFTEAGAVEIAEACAWCGRVDEAFEWLGRALAQRSPGLLDARADPMLASLHGDPRWEPFLAKAGLAD